MFRQPGLGVPLWSWDMGLGADIMATLQWPVLGDPFALVSLLFPMAALETAFATMYVLRMLVAGVAAALYFRVMGAKPLPGAMGAVAYVFTTFLFIQGRHPYFINAMVFLPMLLISLEWALQNRRRWVLVAVVFVTVAANFYFFYILTIVAVIYAVARYFELAEKEERWKRLLPTALRVGGYYTLGVILAAPLLLPAVAAVMQTTRIASDVPLEAFHRSLHYGEMVIALTTSHSAHNSTFLGFAWLGLLAAAALLVRRRYGAVNFMNVAYVALVGFPVFGRVFNGMSFSSNRFAFSWGLFLALAAALLLSEDRPLSRRELAAMGVFLGGYSALLLMTPTPFAVDILVPTLAGVATLAILVLERVRDPAIPWERRARGPRIMPLRWRAPWTRWALVLVLMLNVIANGTFVFDARYQNRLSKHVKWGDVLGEYERNSGRLAANLPDDHFYRIDNGDTLVYNSGMVQGFPNTAYYFSTMNGALTEFKADIDSRAGWSGFAYDGFDERAMPMTLVGTEYYLSDSGSADNVPYGFDEWLRDGDAVAYKNRHALPLGFVYANTIARSDFERLDPVDRPGAMLQGAVVDDADVGLATRVTPTGEAVEVPYSVVPRAERRVVALPSSVSITYSAGRVTKPESWKSPRSPYYWGNRSHLVNLGYQASGVQTITIGPQGVGTLSFESLKVLALPMAQYPSRVEKLRAGAMRDITITTNEVSGTVSSDKPGILFMSIPYSSGWSAEVDGEPVRVLRINTGFSGVAVGPGEHRVTMRYFTPGLKLGLLLGGLGLLVVLGMLVWSRPAVRVSPKR